MALSRNHLLQTYLTCTSHRGQTRSPALETTQLQSNAELSEALATLPPAPIDGKEEAGVVIRCCNFKTANAAMQERDKSEKQVTGIDSDMAASRTKSRLGYAEKERDHRTWD